MVSTSNSQTMIDMEDALNQAKDISGVKIFSVPYYVSKQAPTSFETKIVNLGEHLPHEHHTGQEVLKLAIVKHVIKTHFADDNIQFLNFLDVVPQNVIQLYENPVTCCRDMNLKWKIAIDITFLAYFLRGEQQFDFLMTHQVAIAFDAIVLMQNQMYLPLVAKMFTRIWNRSLLGSLNYTFGTISPFSYSRITALDLDSSCLLECFYVGMVRQVQGMERMKCIKKPFTASCLKTHGVTFQPIVIKPGRKPKSPFEMIRFSNGILRIPKLHLFETRTEMIFRNLIAYETSPACKTSAVQEFVIFMDYLIDTVADLQVLEQSGVIENRLGCDQAGVELWSSLNVSTTTGFTQELIEITVALNLYCSTPYRKLLQEFFNRFLSRPWFVVSLITAIIITSATIIQTVFTILSYYSQLPHNE